MLISVYCLPYFKLHVARNNADIYFSRVLSAKKQFAKNCIAIRAKSQVFHNNVNKYGSILIGLILFAEEFINKLRNFKP